MMKEKFLSCAKILFLWVKKTLSKTNPIFITLFLFEWLLRPREPYSSPIKRQISREKKF